MHNATGRPSPAPDRPKAAEALWAATERLRALEEAAPAAVMAVDQNERITIWNRAAERMFGWRASEIIGRPSPLIPGDRQTEHVDLRARSLRGEAYSGIETYRLHKDGAQIAVSLSAAPIRDSEGHVCGTMGVLTDITGAQRLERQFLQAQKMASIGQLAGGIAHDFNNLLTVIIGYSELALARIPKQPDVSADLEEIKKAGEWAAQLTRQLLTFSRKQLWVPEVLCLNQVVGSFEKILGRVISEAIRLDIVAAPSLERTKADPGHIEQVLMNLVVNARDAMPQGGTLTISTANAVLDGEFARRHAGAVPGRYVSLTVQDTGCGMTPDVLARVFEPFFTTKGPSDGTGLGLSTVYGLVKQSGGYITVESTHGVGSKVTTYLPSVDDLVESVAERPPSEQTLEGTETILLVEDEAGIRNLMRKVLERYGYLVLQARDADHAIAIEDDYPGAIHLLLSDMVMPKLGGPELAQRIVRRRPAIQVLFVSGYAGREITDAGVSSRNISFLQKPFRPETLAQKVRERLDGHVGQPGRRSTSV
jgi:PAS domain S-box-containing protein